MQYQFTCTNKIVVKHLFCIGGNQHHHHSGDNPIGCPKKLTEVIRMGQYNPAKVGSTSAPELRAVCEAVDIPNPTKVHRYFIST